MHLIMESACLEIIFHPDLSSLHFLNLFWHSECRGTSKRGKQLVNLHWKVIFDTLPQDESLIFWYFGNKGSGNADLPSLKNNHKSQNLCLVSINFPAPISLQIKGSKTFDNQIGEIDSSLKPLILRLLSFYLLFDEQVTKVEKFVFSQAIQSIALALKETALSKFHEGFLSIVGRMEDLLDQCANQSFLSTNAYCQWACGLFAKKTCTLDHDVSDFGYIRHRNKKSIQVVFGSFIKQYFVNLSLGHTATIKIQSNDRTDQKLFEAAYFFTDREWFEACWQEETCFCFPEEDREHHSNTFVCLHMSCDV